MEDEEEVQGMPPVAARSKRRKTPSATGNRGGRGSSSQALKSISNDMMNINSSLLPLSELRSEGFEKHEDRLPATLLGPKLLYLCEGDVSLCKSGSISEKSSIGDGECPHGMLLDDKVSFKDDGYLHNKLDDDKLISFEDDPSDYVTIEDVLGIVEKIGPVESLKRILLSTLLDIPRKPNCCINFYPLPDSTRDTRHVGDSCWHQYHHMSELSETVLPPRRYTQCDPLTGPRCFHEPSPVFQIFSMKLQTFAPDIFSPVEVYGIVAVRDGEDYCRNYIFNRSRDNPLSINPTSDYLRLMSLKRALSLKFNCLMEVDIRVKTGEGTEDQTVVDGCMEFIEDQVSFDTLFKCTMDGPYGLATFDFIMFRFGVEATIELDFLRVPPGGFAIQMCAYTSVQKNLYNFIDRYSECDSFVHSVGRFPQHFVAAVDMDDLLRIDFVEGGQPVLFKSAIHGNQVKEYHFRNGAIVSVMVSWSTTNY